MEKISRLNTEARSNLVAYLDGELDEETARGIERELVHSPVVRNEVESLTRTWEMLDLLPITDATEQFTEQTLTAIQLDEYREPLSDKWWFQRARHGVILAGWAAGLAVAAGLGFFITNRAIPSESEILVRELPLIESLDIYSEVDNIAFIKDLQRDGLFDEESHAEDGKDQQDESIKP